MTAVDLRAKLVSLFPEFAVQWDSPENVFRESDGSFSVCGLFAEFSHFVRDRSASLTPPTLDELGLLLESCLDERDPELDAAAATCFLENISGEEFTRALSSHLGPKARSFLAQFEHDAP
jgi:hypothetical protein